MTVAAGAVVPIRAFFSGKSRLSGRLDAPSRAELLRAMAERVVAAAGALPVAVVSSAPEVRSWAAGLGLTLLDDPGSLDDAAAAGTQWAERCGLSRVVIAHADLPLALSLATVIGDGSRPVVTAVPCHHDDGTPVLSLPTGVPFRFHYGAGSFRRHADEARRRGLGFRVVRDASLAYDVDAPEDLAGLGIGPGPAVPGDAPGAPAASHASAFV